MVNSIVIVPGLSLFTYAESQIAMMNEIYDARKAVEMAGDFLLYKNIPTMDMVLVAETAVLANSKRSSQIIRMDVEILVDTVCELTKGLKVTLQEHHVDISRAKKVEVRMVGFDLAVSVKE